MPPIQLICICLVVAVPVCYLAAVAASATLDGRSPVAWPLVLALAGTALGAALIASALAGSAGFTHVVVGRLPSVYPAGLAPSVRVDTLTLAMLALIGFIGVVILAFTRRYLAGDPGRDDPGQRAYRVWFCATLAAVATLVVTNQLWILALAWSTTSLCLHRLLTYYKQRPQALLAAHKKFLISRIADLCIFAAVGLAGMHFGTFQLDAVERAVAVAPWDVTLTIASVLLACSAILACAQLPFHGWLIQVMEAPTPVSALLHAGIVNIGGFLMIRFAMLMAPATLAQTLLVVVGTGTAVTAGLIMSTRVSIKVMLAWSTCAQMGFMLLECGLGLYGLALLHLLAHSLYKAHSFLTSGEMAALSARRARTPVPVTGGGRSWMIVSLLAALAAAAVLIRPRMLDGHPAVLVVVIAALATLAGDAAGAGAILWRRALGGGVAIAVLYAIWSTLFMRLEPARPPADAAGVQIFVAVAFAGLFVLRAMFASRHGARRLRWLHPHVYGGFYLDQLFTRLTLVIWPPRLPEHRHHAIRRLPVSAPLETDA